MVSQRNFAIGISILGFVLAFLAYVGGGTVNSFAVVYSLFVGVLFLAFVLFGSEARRDATSGALVIILTPLGIPLLVTAARYWSWQWGLSGVVVILVDFALFARLVLKGAIR